MQCKDNMSDLMQRPLPEFLSSYMKPTEGRFIDIASGKVVGKHFGAEFLTIGQRPRISGATDRYFICKKVRDNNEFPGCYFGDVMVVKGHRHPALYSDYMLVRFEDFKFINRFNNDCFDDSRRQYYCKTRSYPKALRPCRVQVVSLSDVDDEKQHDATLPEQIMDDTVSVGLDIRSVHELKALNRVNSANKYFKIMLLDGPERALTPGQVS